MRQPTVEQLARQLYDACPTPKPTWDQIGEPTKSVWRERAARITEAQLMGDELSSQDASLVDSLLWGSL